MPMPMKNQFLLLFTVFATVLHAQSVEVIVPFYDAGKWGFMNKNKEIVVRPEFQEAYPPSAGLCRVKQDGKYGFIGIDGKIRIRTKYDRAEDFVNGVAMVSRKGKTTYIKPNGKKNTISFGTCGKHFCLTPSFAETITIYEVGKKKGIYRKRSSAVDTLPPKFDSIMPITHQLMYLIKEGKGDFLHEGSFGRGLPYFKEAIDLKYDDLKLFNCDFCREGYRTTFGVKVKGLWGFMEGQIIPEWHIEPRYLSVEGFDNGFALVEFETGRFGYIDDQGNEYFFR